MGDYTFKLQVFSSFCSVKMGLLILKTHCFYLPQFLLLLRGELEIPEAEIQLNPCSVAVNGRSRARHPKNWLKYHLALQYGFELPGQLGHTWHPHDLLQMKRWHYRSWGDCWNQEAIDSIFPPVLLFSMLRNQILHPLCPSQALTHSQLSWNVSPRIESLYLHTLLRVPQGLQRWLVMKERRGQHNPQDLESSGVEGRVCQA